jgi:hypothetical protein
LLDLLICSYTSMKMFLFHGHPHNTQKLVISMIVSQKITVAQCPFFILNI